MGATGFMNMREEFGEIAEPLYKNRITVAASVNRGRGYVAIHGVAPGGGRIGGLYSLESARKLIADLENALEYVESLGGH